MISTKHIIDFLEENFPSIEILENENSNNTIHIYFKYKNKLGSKLLNKIENSLEDNFGNKIKNISVNISKENLGQFDLNQIYGDIDIILKETKGKLTESIFLSKFHKFLSTLWKRPAEIKLLKTIDSLRGPIQKDQEKGKEYLKTLVDNNQNIIRDYCSNQFSDELQKLINDYKITEAKDPFKPKKIIDRENLKKEEDSKKLPYIKKYLGDQEYFSIYRNEFYDDNYKILKIIPEGIVVKDLKTKKRKFFNNQDLLNMYEEFDYERLLNFLNLKESVNFNDSGSVFSPFNSDEELNEDDSFKPKNIKSREQQITLENKKKINKVLDDSNWISDPNKNVKIHDYTTKSLIDENYVGKIYTFYFDEYNEFGDYGLVFSYAPKTKLLEYIYFDFEPMWMSFTICNTFEDAKTISKEILEAYVKQMDLNPWKSKESEVEKILKHFSKGPLQEDIFQPKKISQKESKEKLLLKQKVFDNSNWISDPDKTIKIYGGRSKNTYNESRIGTIYSFYEEGFKDDYINGIVCSFVPKLKLLQITNMPGHDDPDLIEYFNCDSLADAKKITLQFILNEDVKLPFIHFQRDLDNLFSKLYESNYFNPKKIIHRDEQKDKNIRGILSGDINLPWIKKSSFDLHITKDEENIIYDNTDIDKTLINDEIALKLLNTSSSKDELNELQDSTPYFNKKTKKLYSDAPYIGESKNNNIMNKSFLKESSIEYLLRMDPEFALPRLDEFFYTIENDNAMRSWERYKKELWNEQGVDNWYDYLEATNSTGRDEIKTGVGLIKLNNAVPAAVHYLELHESMASIRENYLYRPTDDYCYKVKLFSNPYADRDSSIYFDNEDSAKFYVDNSKGKFEYVGKEKITESYDGDSSDYFDPQYNDSIPNKYNSIPSFDDDLNELYDIDSENSNFLQELKDIDSEDMLNEEMTTASMATFDTPIGIHTKNKLQEKENLKKKLKDYLGKDVSNIDSKKNKKKDIVTFKSGKKYHYTINDDTTPNFDKKKLKSFKDKKSALEDAEDFINSKSQQLVEGTEYITDSVNLKIFDRRNQPIFNEDIQDLVLLLRKDYGLSKKQILIKSNQSIVIKNLPLEDLSSVNNAVKKVSKFLETKTIGFESDKRYYDIEKETYTENLKESDVFKPKNIDNRLKDVKYDLYYIEEVGTEGPELYKEYIDSFKTYDELKAFAIKDYNNSKDEIFEKKYHDYLESFKEKNKRSFKKPISLEEFKERSYYSKLNSQGLPFGYIYELSNKNERMEDDTDYMPENESKSDKKVEKVMGEFKRGELHSGSKSGPIVKNRDQAIAIALSSAGKSKKK